MLVEQILAVAFVGGTAHDRTSRALARWPMCFLFYFLQADIVQDAHQRLCAQLGLGLIGAKFSWTGRGFTALRSCLVAVESRVR